MPKYAVFDHFLSSLCVSSPCAGLGEGGCRSLITIRHCVFITFGARAVSQAHPGTLSHHRSHCLGLPAQRQVLFILICIMYICSESSFCWNLKSQVLAARAWSDLLEIWTQRRDTPQPSVTGYHNVTAVQAWSFKAPGVISTAELIFWPSFSRKAFLDML